MDLKPWITKDETNTKTRIGLTTPDNQKQEENGLFSKTKQTKRGELVSPWHQKAEAQHRKVVARARII